MKTLILNIYVGLVLGLVLTSQAFPNRRLRRENQLDENRNSAEEQINILRRIRESGETSATRILNTTERAKAARMDAVKEQVESLLNIKGKVLPSAKEELGEFFFPTTRDPESDLWSKLNFRRNNDYTQAENSDVDPIDLTPDPNQEYQFDDEEPPYSDFTEKLQSFYPECSLPHRVEKSSLVSQQLKLHQHFFFRTDQIIPKSNHHINFLYGKLKLYQNDERDEFSINANEDQIEKLRITVSWVKRGNKDFELIMLDSKMVSRYRKQWLQFDILPAVQMWQKRPKKNFGIVVEVEDEDRFKLPADKIFRMMNCSDYRVRRPFPSVLDDISEDLLDLNSVGSAGSGDQPEVTSLIAETLNTHLYPMLDVCSIEIPDGESLPVNMPVISLDMANKIMHSFDADKMPTDNSTDDNHILKKTTETPIEDFPMLHNVHIRHRLPHTTTTTATTEVTQPTTTTTSEMESSTTATVQSSTEGDTLERLEEINFLTTEATSSTTSTPIQREHHQDPWPHRPLHRQLRRNRDNLGSGSAPEFKPTHKRVVMTRQNLLAALKKMVQRQDQDIERETRRFLSEIDSD